MKERRSSGATHSFRLTREAAELVDNMTHPRRLGGKSRKVSDAIVAYFGTPFGGAGMPSYDRLLQSIAFLQDKVDEMAGSSQVADDEAQHVPQSRARRLISWIIGWFRI